MKCSLCFALAITVLLGALVIGNPCARCGTTGKDGAGDPGLAPGRRASAPGTGASESDRPIPVQPAAAGASAQAAQASLARPVQEGIEPAALRLSSPRTASSELPDPDRVGECPREGVFPRVIRRGIDVDRWPTWWHLDGSLTKRVVQNLSDESGVVVRAPAVMVLKPGKHRLGNPAKPAGGGSPDGAPDPVPAEATRGDLR